MSDRELKRLKVAFIYLQEIQYAYVRWNEGKAIGSQGHSTQMRFYFNALIAQIHAHFIAGGGSLLKKLDDDRIKFQLEKIRTLLDKHVGHVTIRRVVTLFRNSYLEHNVELLAKNADTKIAKETGLTATAQLARFHPVFDELCQEVVNLGAAIHDLIPSDDFVSPDESPAHRHSLAEGELRASTPQTHSKPAAKRASKSRSSGSRRSG